MHHVTHGQWLIALHSTGGPESTAARLPPEE